MGGKRQGYAFGHKELEKGEELCGVVAEKVLRPTLLLTPLHALGHKCTQGVSSLPPLNKGTEVELMGEAEDVGKVGRKRCWVCSCSCTPGGSNKGLEAPLAAPQK